MSRIVVSIHGIRTRGLWQKMLAPVLARHGFVPYLLDYGYFSTLPFLCPACRRRKLKWLVEALGNIYTTENVKRVSIIAHSFGTYLTAGVLEGYSSFQFDKIVFAGSIVNRDFDWPKFLSSGRVNLVRNDYGRLDVWPLFAKSMVRSAGDSGRLGFTARHDNLRNVEFPRHRHSDYFHSQHYTEHWLPTLEHTVAAPLDQVRISEKLNLIAQHVAQIIHTDPSNLRANIFALSSDGLLRIPAGFFYNMTDKEELATTMAVGVGCAGITYERRQPNIAIRGDNRWGKHMLPDSALSRLNPDLKWVIGMPISDPDTGVPLGALNIDGLNIPKSLEDLYPLTFALYDQVQQLGTLMRKTL